MKVAVVIPWFGRDLKGGAEQQTWQIATRLAARKHSVDVLTTCCRSFHDDWATNHLAAGTTAEPEGFRITRFPVLARDRAAFDQVCGKLMAVPREQLRPGVSPIAAEEADIWTKELIKSPALLAHVSQTCATYDHFLLLPYLYGPIIQAVRLLGEKAALQPCLHDEAYAYLPAIAESFYRAGRLLFNSSGEFELACGLFGPSIVPKSYVVGEGVEFPTHLCTGAPDLDTTGGQRFILYLGRKEEGKNVNLLVNAFRRFRVARPNSTLRLVLAGHGELKTESCLQVEDRGTVSEDEKLSLLRQCLALAQPSANESFSRAMMEGWLAKKPVLVHAECLATATAVREAKGGLIAKDESQWAANLAAIDRMPPAELDRLGRNGQAYARKMADWDAVMLRYEATFSESAARPREPKLAGLVIDQCLPNLTYGDAISEHSLFIRDELRRRGADSHIYAQFSDVQMRSEAEPFTPAALQDSTAVIYHHSIGSEITPQVISFTGRKALIYHNITPPEFFEPWQPEFARLLDRGRDELSRMAECVHVSFGVSEYNAEELAGYGFRSGVIPLAVDPAKWGSPPDPALMDRLQDGRTNLLFVGRIAPNKKQDDLLLAFACYRRFDPNARLILVGQFHDSDPYFQHLRLLIVDLHLSDSVELCGNVDGTQIHAYYRTADLFWSMSEHEGFCVPLIEAMWFDVPVFAYRSSAVPETLGAAALMFSNKGDMDQLAAFAYLVVKDETIRAKIIEAQRRRRIDFAPENISPFFDNLLEQLLRDPHRGAREASKTRDSISRNHAERATSLV